MSSHLGPSHRRVLLESSSPLAARSPQITPGHPPTRSHPRPPSAPLLPPLSPRPPPPLPQPQQAPTSFAHRIALLSRRAAPALAQILPLHALERITDEIGRLEGQGKEKEEVLATHLAWSASSRQVREFYVSLGDEFWRSLLRKRGWAVPQNAPSAWAAAMALIEHRSHCTVAVLKPSEYAIKFTTPAGWEDPDDEMELCSPSIRDNVWPPRDSAELPHPDSIRPHPLLSDVHLTLTSILHPRTLSLLSSLGVPLPLVHHPCLGELSAVWPPAQTVEIEWFWEGIGWEDGKSFGLMEQFKMGKCLMEIEAEGDFLTVRELWEGISEWWRAEMNHEEVKVLVKKYPDLIKAAPEEKGVKGGHMIRLKNIRLESCRWAWVGDYTVFVGFLPSLNDPSRLTAHLVRPSALPPSSPASNQPVSRNSSPELPPSPIPGLFGHSLEPGGDGGYEMDLDQLSLDQPTWVGPKIDREGDEDDEMRLVGPWVRQREEGKQAEGRVLRRRS